MLIRKEVMVDAAEMLRKLVKSDGDKVEIARTCAWIEALNHANMELTRVRAELGIKSLQDLHKYGVSEPKRSGRNPWPVRKDGHGGLAHQRRIGAAMNKINHKANEEKARMLWNEGFNTVEIARILDKPESGVRLYLRDMPNVPYTPDEVQFATRQAAEKVLDSAIEMAERPGGCSVGEFYELCGIRPKDKDYGFGWQDLKTASVNRISHDRAYIIVLPPTVELGGCQ